MERQILHIDCNKFYASVECLLHPELRDKPVAVGGSVEERHGIILTKNEIASKYNLIVGEPIWKAKQKCPELIVVEPNFPIYAEYSKKVRKILEDYTDLIEPFGLDESWIDVTGDWKKTGVEIAFEIKERVKNEIGITVSVGVSFNKIFAKLGSDYKKPDAVTVITRDNYKDIVWCLPCSDLLMVGKATTRKLNSYGIFTIGELANADTKFLKNILGKNGETLKSYANGLDCSQVQNMNYVQPIKSIGNSTTSPRDLVSDNDIKVVFTVLGECVAKRMREKKLKCTTVSISVRDKSLCTFTRQCKLQSPTNLSSDLIEVAIKLFKTNYDKKEPVRSLGIAVTDFETESAVQYDISGKALQRERREKLEFAVDKLKDKYGNCCIKRGILLSDKKLSQFNMSASSTFHPLSS